MLTGLGHRAVSRGDHQNGAVHLSGTGNHVLDIIRVTGTVNVSIVSVVRLILLVTGGNRDATCLLFRCIVNLVESPRVTKTLGCLACRNRRGQSRLAVIDMTDRAYVDVRLAANECVLRHRCGSPARGCAIWASLSRGVIRKARGNSLKPIMGSGPHLGQLLR